MNERYIAISGSGGYGSWGAGPTINDAKRNLHQARGKVRGLRVFRFTSESPFAPADRDAGEDEADCWVGQDGSVNWIRCEREEVAC